MVGTCDPLRGVSVVSKWKLTRGLYGSTFLFKEALLARAGLFKFSICIGCAKCQNNMTANLKEKVLYMEVSTDHRYEVHSHSFQLP